LSSSVTISAGVMFMIIVGFLSFFCVECPKNVQGKALGRRQYDFVRPGQATQPWAFSRGLLVQGFDDV
jgi:hypothetical protein